MAYIGDYPPPPRPEDLDFSEGEKPHLCYKGLFYPAKPNQTKCIEKEYKMLIILNTYWDNMDNVFRSNS